MLPDWAFLSALIPQADGRRFAGSQPLERVHDSVYVLAMPWNSETQARVARARRIVQHVCAECGMPFEAMRIRKYHSRACQVRAYRRRKKEAETLTGER